MYVTFYPFLLGHGQVVRLDTLDESIDSVKKIEKTERIDNYTKSYDRRAIKYKKMPTQTLYNIQNYNVMHSPNHIFNPKPNINSKLRDTIKILHQCLNKLNTLFYIRIQFHDSIRNVFK